MPRGLGSVGVSQPAAVARNRLFAYVSLVKSLVGALMFLVFAKDKECAYAAHLGAPLRMDSRILLVEPLQIKLAFLI